jgi:hypothetical protein
MFGPTFPPHVTESELGLAITGLIAAGLPSGTIAEMTSILLEIFPVEPRQKACTSAATHLLPLLDKTTNEADHRRVTDIIVNVLRHSTK